MAFELFPAIDVRGGRCVRLRQGDYADETVYSDDPVLVAESFVDAGARWIHVVDLDAARTGEPVNRSVVLAIAERAGGRGVQVQSGGGVRTVEAAHALLDGGVARVVIGTAAVERPALVSEVAAHHEHGVVLGLDVRMTDGRAEVALHGWTKGSGRDLLDVLRELESAGAAAVVVTEIGRDGMLTGPDLTLLDQVAGATTLGVVASGGVATLDDVRALRTLPLDGVIVGKAIYERRFTVAEAVAACRREG